MVSPAPEVKLTPRMIEVVILIGRLRLPYKAAAKRMGISHHTVRDYARDVRDLTGSPLPPRDALTAYYLQHSDELEAA